MPDRIRTLIVDDEPLARDGIRHLLSSDDRFEIIGECQNGKEAVATIRADNPALVFLDIQMPSMSGMQVVSALTPPRPLIVFVTAYDEFAVQAFDVHALDYLLKPVDPDRFRKTLARIAGAIQEDRIGQISDRLEQLVGNLQKSGTSLDSSSPYLTRFIIKSAGLIYFVQADDIDWIEAADYYVRLHTGKKNHLLRDSLNRLETRLDPNTFIRIHRSTIVNLSRVKELKPHFQGEYIVTLTDGTDLKLSRTHRDKLQALLGQSI